MLTPGQQEAVKKLLESGLSITQVAKRLRHSAATVARYKAIQARSSVPSDELLIPDHIPEKIRPFEDYIRRHLKDRRNNIVRLFQDLQERGYDGSYSSLYSYILNVAGPRQRAYKPAVRVETDPGEQAQVDWGYVGTMNIGDRIEKISVFVYVLSYSRMTYIEFVTRQNQQTLQDCHIHAFERLGIPKKIRYDNMKTVVLNRERLPEGGWRAHLNPAFVEFAKYYGFEIDPCPAYWPRAKGKVEAGVKYVKGNFLDGKPLRRSYKNLEVSNEAGDRWLQRVANRRIHGTTGEKPYERWLKEKPCLKFPLGLPRYNSTPLLTRWSTKDGQVQYKSNSYSVPTVYAQKKLMIREASDLGLPFLEIYYGHRLIARHAVFLGRGKWVVDATHMHNEETPVSRENGRASTKETKVWRNIRVGVRESEYYDILSIPYGKK